MNTKSMLPLVQIGRPANPPRACLANTILAWSEMEGDGQPSRWVTCSRTRQNHLRFTKYTSRDGGREKGELALGQTEPFVATDWNAARAWLVTQTADLYLPGELLDCSIPGWIIPWEMKVAFGNGVGPYCGPDPQPDALPPLDEDKLPTNDPLNDPRQYILDLVAMGRPAAPTAPFWYMRRAFMIWASDDRSGDPYFWWVTARRRAHNCLEVNLWNGGVGLENWNDWSEEICEKQTVTNWLELRSWLVTKAEKLLYLPMELLDEGVRRLIRNQVAPYLAGV